MATIKVTGPVREETKPKKDGSGNYTKRVQDVVIETSSCKITTELDVETGKEWPVGDYIADLEAQLKPGRFGLEIPRYLKLTPKLAAAKSA
jgi:hypothetical protein